MAIPILSRNVLQNLAEVDWDFANVSTNSLTHGIHPYPAKYIPQIPSALIQELSAPEETVADVFCGSGTTLVEALSLSRNAVGVDANPLACLISEVKTTRLTVRDEKVLRDLVARAKALSVDVTVRHRAFFAPHGGFISDALARMLKL